MFVGVFKAGQTFRYLNDRLNVLEIGVTNEIFRKHCCEFHHFSLAPMILENSISLKKFNRNSIRIYVCIFVFSFNFCFYFHNCDCTI